jgi:hypothetical protein
VSRVSERKHRFRMEVLDNLIHAIEWHMDTADWDSYHVDDEWTKADTEALKAEMIKEKQRLLGRKLSAENRWRESL